QQAPIIFKALQAARENVKNGLTDANQVRDQITKMIQTSPLARIDYVEIIDDQTLTPVETVKPGTFAAVAVYYGKTRLIDNIYLKER
ncbi:MAG TPA: pantoate--beta-alanine ligase, partial [Candidatus Marinimicrobia bacterium]|nr:pantoate--beta-alanine ligase [Candidatus Neomarinimicrobiota bacterium]HQO74545.1 pantoate--beta-alanine ligase [Candidatus Neomarinimicrobiota bacterium]HQQ85637.1 pantoate--beta-alanine ligase [Candidatus Neomarinimicrobiota bacterium]